MSKDGKSLIEAMEMELEQGHKDLMNQLQQGTSNQGVGEDDDNQSDGCLKEDEDELVEEGQEQKKKEKARLPHAKQRLDDVSFEPCIDDRNI